MEPNFRIAIRHVGILQDKERFLHHKLLPCHMLLLDLAVPNYATEN